MLEFGNNVFENSWHITWRKHVLHVDVNNWCLWVLDRVSKDLRESESVCYFLLSHCESLSEFVKHHILKGRKKSIEDQKYGRIWLMSVDN